MKLYLHDMRKHAAQQLLHRSVQLFVQAPQRNHAAAVNRQRVERIPDLRRWGSRVAQPKQSCDRTYHHPDMQLKFFGKTLRRSLRI